jgi:hypothetical protein
MFLQNVGGLLLIYTALFWSHLFNMNWDSKVTAHRLNSTGCGSNFSPGHDIQAGSRIYPPSFPVGTGAIFSIANCPHLENSSVIFI